MTKEQEETERLIRKAVTVGICEYIIAELLGKASSNTVVEIANRVAENFSRISKTPND